MNHLAKATLKSTRVALFFFTLAGLAGCSIAATRPVQEMSDAVAAMKAAREVQADSNAPEYFRLSEELYFKARQEYKLKNFSRAKKLAEQAREAAEKAEFLSIRAGATRSSLIGAALEEPPAPAAAAPAPTPPTAPTPP